MATKLSKIDIRASLDASGYVEGARQKQAADAAMIDSDQKVQASVATTQQRLSQSGTAIGY
jgi:hypothetical protein